MRERDGVKERERDGETERKRDKERETKKERERQRLIFIYTYQLFKNTEFTHFNGTAEATYCYHLWTEKN
jgi:hypothetical protein